MAERVAGLLGVASAFLRRDLASLRTFRYPFALDALFAALQLVVTYYVSQTFPDIGGSRLDGAPSYFAFAAVGIAMASVVEAATETVASRIREGQLSGTLEMLIAQPVGTLQLCVGYTGFAFIMAMLRVVAYTAVIVLVVGTDVSRVDWFGLFAVILLTGASLAALGIVVGAVVLIFQRGQQLAGTVLFLMTIVCGSVFPTSVLPSAVAAVGRYLPLRLAFDGSRDAMFAGQGWGLEALGLLAYALCGLPVAVLTFGKAVDVARARGSLGRY